MAEVVDVGVAFEGYGPHAVPPHACGGLTLVGLRDFLRSSGSPAPAPAPAYAASAPTVFVSHARGYPLQCLLECLEVWECATRSAHEWGRTVYALPGACGDGARDAFLRSSAAGITHLLLAFGGEGVSGSGSATPSLEEGAAAAAAAAASTPPAL